MRMLLPRAGSGNGLDLREPELRNGGGGGAPGAPEQLDDPGHGPGANVGTNRRVATTTAERTSEDAGEVVVRCLDVARCFGPVRAVDGASLEVRRSEVVALIGPSGCGKTTLLRLIAGFEIPDRGSVEIGGRVVAQPGRSVPPERRQVGVVFQDYALFPHLTVAENVTFGLAGGQEQSRQTAARWIRRVGLEGLEDRYPHELSGGQQQRVAVARALATRPHLLLLDEPFASLDLALRVRLRREIREIIRQEGLAALLVTHDREEALSAADRVAVMAGGRILQLAAPEEVYQRPVSPGVAALLGDVNLLPGWAEGDTAKTAIGPVPLEGPHPSGPVLVLLRPEWLACVPDPEGPLRVVKREFYGAYQTVALGGGTGADGTGTLIRARCPAVPIIRKGERVRVRPLQPATAYPQGAAIDQRVVSVWG